MPNFTQNLSVFGWNWSFLGDINLETDSQGNVTLLNSGIQSLLPQQLPDTALYGTSNQSLPPEQLVNSPYNVSTQQLLVLGSSVERTFERQAAIAY